MVKDTNGSTTVEITPTWIESELKDPQLAAALRAALGRLETGQWPQVGESGAEQLLRLQKRQALARRRDLLRESLDKVHEELEKLDAPEPDAAVDGSDAADAESPSSDAPETPSPNGAQTGAP